MVMDKNKLPPKIDLDNIWADGLVVRKVNRNIIYSRRLRSKANVFSLSFNSVFRDPGYTVLDLLKATSHLIKHMPKRSTVLKKKDLQTIESRLAQLSEVLGHDLFAPLSAPNLKLHRPVPTLDRREFFGLERLVDEATAYLYDSEPSADEDTRESCLAKARDVIFDAVEGSFKERQAEYDLAIKDANLAKKQIRALQTRIENYEEAFGIENTSTYGDFAIRPRDETKPYMREDSYTP